MTTSTLITDYLGIGLAAARPASLSLPAGAVGFYYEEDNNLGFMWDQASTSWVQVTGLSGGSTPSIVQNAAEADSTSGSITLATAPTQNNLLIAFCSNAANVTAASGWAYVAIQGTGVGNGGTIQGNGTDFAAVLWKIAGASESATQTPITGTGAGGIMMYEIATGAASMALCLDTSGASGTLTLEALRSSTGGLIIGALCNNSTTDLPTLVPGTADTTANTASRSMAGFHATPAQGPNALSWTYAGSHDIKQFGLLLY
jgi:hypothetical protein